MEFFRKGNNIKLKSHLDKFLIADDDQETIRQSGKGDKRRAIWTVEPVVDKPNLIRLKSSHGTYLTASNKPLQLGITGEKVIQTRWVNKLMDRQTQWEPERDGFQLKLKSWSGKWLSATGGKSPLRKSVTHDESSHTSETKNWMIWDVITVDASVLENMFGVGVDDDDERYVSSPVFGSGVKSEPPVPARGLKSFGRFASLSLPMSPKEFPKLEKKRKGFQGKLKSWSSKWLNVKCGMPQWRNSVTQEEPNTPNTKNCLIWDVLSGYVVENITDGDDNGESSVSSLFSGLAPGSPVSARSNKSVGRYTSFSLPVSPRRSQKLETTSSFNQKETVSPMDFLHIGKAIRMRNGHNKYLTADDDEETVTQTKNGLSKNARWIVEQVRDSYHIIRLKSCYGTYLAASNERFLVGATGKKVIQLKPSQLDSSIEWEPVREGLHIKFRTRSGNYLLANSGLNSVTHDFPQLPADQDSISWHVDVVDFLTDFECKSEYPQSPPKVTPLPHQRSVKFSRISSAPLERFDSDSFETPSKVTPAPPPKVTLVPHQKSSNLPLSAEYSRTSSSLSESSDSYLVESLPKVTLTPTPHQRLTNLLSLVESLKTSSSLSEKSDLDSFESPPNETLPPIKVTPPPHRKLSNLPLSVEFSRNSSFFSEESDSDSVESPPKVTLPPIKVTPPPHRKLSNLSLSFKSSRTSSSLSEKSDSDSTESTPNSAGRTVYYHIADKDGHVEEEFRYAFTFKGNSVAELTQTLREETCLKDVVVCTRSPLNGKMIPLRLQLPPNSGTLHVVLVPSTSSLY